MPSHEDTTFILKCDKNTLFKYDATDNTLCVFDLKRKGNKNKVLTELANNLENFKDICEQTSHVGKKLNIEKIRVFEHSYIDDIERFFKSFDIDFVSCCRYNQYKFTLSKCLTLGDKNFVEPEFPEDILNVVKERIEIKEYTLGFCTPDGHFDKRFFDTNIFPAFSGYFISDFEHGLEYNASFTVDYIDEMKLRLDELKNFCERLNKLGCKTSITSGQTNHFTVTGYFDTKPEKIYSHVEKQEIDFKTAVYSIYHSSYLSQYIKVDLSRCDRFFGQLVTKYKEDYLSTIHEEILHTGKRILDYVETVDGVNYLMSTVNQFIY